MPSKYPLRVKKSQIDGVGIFAVKRIPAKRKIGELTGEVISVREARKRARNRRRITIVEISERTAIDSTKTEDILKFMNHACLPNVYMRIFRHRIEFYSLHSIRSGEELCCDYGLTHHSGALACNCGKPGCRRNI